MSLAFMTFLWWEPVSWTYGLMDQSYGLIEIQKLLGNVTQWAAAFKENTPKKSGQVCWIHKVCPMARSTQILLESKLILHTESWSHQIREEAVKHPVVIFFEKLFALMKIFHAHPLTVRISWKRYLGCNGKSTHQSTTHGLVVYLSNLWLFYYMILWIQ